MSAPSIEVLLVEANPGDIFLVERMLLQPAFRQVDVSPFSLTTRTFLRDAIATLSQNHFDVVLLDLSLPDSHKSDTFSTWQSYNFDIPVIIFTVSDDREMALRSLQQLWVMLANLLRNAWKYTSKKNDVCIEFGVIATPKNLSYSDTDHSPDMKSIMEFLPKEMANSDQPVYFVRDNGAGFNMEDAERLFAPFSRLHSNDEFEGSGIGLAIVQRIIHNLEGIIGAGAVVNEGATFYFTLSPQITSSQSSAHQHLQVNCGIAEKKRLPS